MAKRVCVIGAGPSGMSVLYHFARMEGAPEIVCYEKQSNWGGLWNFTWRTGMDKYGEAVHGSMYHHLWSNGPKECLEFPDYTFEEHFGKVIPSFPPREVLRDYLEGHWKKDNKDLRKYIKFLTAVKNVTYNPNTDDFTVLTKDLEQDLDQPPQRFTHVIVAIGMFSTPNMPDFPGLDTFPGRVLHAHDFRDAKEFAGKRVLAIGASYSAEDVALQCKKFGASHVICTWRTKPMGFKWPEGVEERPLLQKVNYNTVYFKDGTSAEIDVIFLCTGYLYHYPFLPDNLRLKSRTSLYPPHLYKGTVWTKGGNNKLLYVGPQDQYYTFTMFDAQALWACRFIMGSLPVNKMKRKEMEEHVKQHVETWRIKNEAVKDCHDAIDFQSEFISDLSEDAGYPEKAVKAGDLFHKWEHQKDENIATYRDQTFPSVFTGNMANAHHTPFMEAMDDSLDTYVNQTPNKVIS